MVVEGELEGLVDVEGLWKEIRSKARSISWTSVGFEVSFNVENRLLGAETIPMGRNH